jgi:hypothetical protein
MSQRIIHYYNVRAQAGWDRPLQYLYLVVEDTEAETFIFSNLDRVNPGMTISEIRTTLKRYNVPVPVTPRHFLADLEADRRNNAGNLVAHYRFDEKADDYTYEEE